ncbi:MAG: hypothetical protein IKM09_00350 [Clostridia bacterium]|nr:hypothetical protein [Clostridia bacterium]MBR6741872.1 hypothetical protein [Clostridia bacterium]
MKKILAIALTLTLILALAVMPTSAATLSSNWNEIWNMCLDANGAQEQAGEAIADDTGAITLNNDGFGWFSKVGLVYNEKVTVDGLELIISIDNLYDGADLPGMPTALTSFVNVILSADKADNFVQYDVTDGTNPMGGFSNGLNMTAATSAALTFAMNNDRASWSAFGGMDSAIKVSYENLYGNFADEADITVKFVANGDNIDILLDGQVAMSFAAAEVLDADGKAYLAFAANGYGNAAANMTVKAINGQTANSFLAAGGGTPYAPDAPESSEPAPSEPESSIVITPPAENKGGCGNNA